MAAIPIQFTSQAITLTDVRGVVVTDVVQDQDNGEYVREIRIFGGDNVPVPPIQNTDAPLQGQGHLLVTLRLKTADRRKIFISIPSLEF